MLSVHTKYCQRGYENAISQVHRQYGLRNRNVPITSNKRKQNAKVDAYHKEVVVPNQSKDKVLAIPNHVKGNEDSFNIQRKDKEVQDGGQKKESSHKYKPEKNDAPLKEV